MYGYIYMTTNLVNGKKYIGKRTSNKFLGNNYLGSGKILFQAIEKYGVTNFEVTLIETIDTNLDDLNEREKYWISYYNATNSKEFYNIKPGGDGGNGSGWHHTEDAKHRIAESNRKSQLARHHKHSEETKKKMSESRSGENNTWWKGHKHTVESRQKMSVAKKNNLPIQCTSKGNPMKGRIWITKDTESKVIFPNELDSYIQQGWSKGRYITEESKIKNSNSNKGRIPWNKGIKLKD